MKLIFILLATLLTSTAPHTPNPRTAQAPEAQAAPRHHPIEKFIR
jgi:hypothetical protein